MKKKIPKILWHHGSCDYCKKKHILILHFGYDTQPKRDYRICIKCLLKNTEMIIYGFINHNVDSFYV